MPRRRKDADRKTHNAVTGAGAGAETEPGAGTETGTEGQRDKQGSADICAHMYLTGASARAGTALQSAALWLRVHVRLRLHRAVS